MSKTVRRKNQMLRTLMFVAAAVATLLLAAFTRPPTIEVDTDSMVGQALFPEFADPLSANGLEVLSYDEDLGRLNDFRVAQQEAGIWVIPSHQNYPADAENRLEEAATMFVDLEAINVISEAEGDHAVYGVVQPNRDSTTVGEAGVGTLVNVYGLGTEGRQKKLVELIIGKQVKGLPGQHYVRLPGRPRVYQVKIDPTRLSTRFEDWIQTDLLSLSPTDIASITMKDYSVDIGQGQSAQLFQRFQVTARAEPDGWVLDDYREFRDGELQVTALTEGEELNTEQLNTLQTSLDDLRIVDVQRKPRGLGADLTTDSKDAVGMQSLVQRGFYPVGGQGDDGTVELVSSDGELLINTRTGVQYVLRFGQIAGVGQSSMEPDENNELRSGGLNRFLLITARVSEDQIVLAELDPLPAGANDAEATELSNELVMEIDQIKKSNQRKQDAYEEQLAAAQKAVDDLNYRFADWYYIISDDVFRKVHLGRSEVIRMSEEAKKKGDGIAAFRELQRQGLRSDN